jgi:MFS transporter, DHA1 family, multidrug resistance protein
VTAPRNRHAAPVTAWLVLGALFGLQPITTDLFLPALPEIREALGASAELTQWTMSGLMMAFGLGQLVWGPVADRFGRRPVLLASLALLTFAAAGSSLAQSMPALVAWRVAQGASLAAVIMCARAIVRDLYEPHEGAMVMSRAMSVLGVCAIASPSLGGVLAYAFGWRVALLGVAMLSGFALALIAWRWPETATPNPQALKLGPYARQLAQIARHPGFRAYALLVGCTYAALFTFLSASAFVYIGWLGLSTAAYGVVMALASLAYLVGTWVTRSLIAKHGVTGAVRLGSIGSVSAALAFIVVAWTDARNLWALLLPQLVFHFAHGIHQPCGQAGAVAWFPRAAGVASSLSGFTMAALAVLTGMWLGHASDGTQRPMVWGIVAWSMATAIVGLTLVQRHGGPLDRAQRTQAPPSVR